MHSSTGCVAHLKARAAMNSMHFFNANMGAFLRNAVMNRFGNLKLHQKHGLAPLSPIVSSNSYWPNYQVRVVPEDATNLILGLASDYLPSTVLVYGWRDAGGLLRDNQSRYWLLVADRFDRLVWVASVGVSHDEIQVKTAPELTESAVSELNISEPYDSHVLPFILGDSS